jgi:regulator of protease activity HflC (stomatin/prohibitin superfamily)
MNNKTGKVSVVASILVVIVVVVVLFRVLCITIVPTGSTGVMSTFDQVHEEPVHGVCFHAPLITKIEKVNNKQQDLVSSSRIYGETAERTECYYDEVAVTYQISSTGSVWIYCNVTDYKENTITERMIMEAVRSVSKLQKDTDATNRNIMSAGIQAKIQEACDITYGEEIIKINKVTIGNADFSPEYNAAIEAKNQAKIEAEKQEYINKKAIEEAEGEAERKRIEAQGNAEQKRLEAQGEADSTRIKAEATAEANRVIAESLSEELLRQKAIETWSGEYPDIVAGDSTGMILNIPELKNNAE